MTYEATAEDVEQTLELLRAELNDARTRVKELEHWIWSKDYDLVEEGLAGDDDEEDDSEGRYCRS